MAAIHKPAVCSGLGQLLNSGEYSDLTLICEGEEFKVHKAVVCYQSPVIAAAVGHGLPGAGKDVLYIKDFRPKSAKQMLEFMYTGDYTISVDSESRAQFTSVSQLVELLLEQIRVDAIADYYDLPELRKLSKTKAKLILEEDWDNGWFLSCVQEAFKVCKDVPLRKLMAEVAAAHIDELLRDDQFTRMGIMDDFAFAIITNLVTKNRNQEKMCADQIETVRSQLYVAELESDVAADDKEQYEDYA